MRLSRVAQLLSLVPLCIAARSAHATGDSPVDLGRIEVIGTAPLPGMATPLEQVPSNVQTFGSRDIERQRTGGVAEFLNFNANSVNINSPTGNSFQPDVSFRGFTASSLIGTPQGLSVFQDGVRINEAFADIVNWDLIPKSAVASMQLLPGSNPVFGLNTLGGALTINMKDGFRFAGAGAEVSAGSFGRTSLSADAGGNNGTVAGYAAFEGIDDKGWREHSSSRIRRMYARGDVHTANDDFNLALTLADNYLEGTQALPVSMLDQPRQAYTWPDTTDNNLTFVSANWQHTLAADTVIAANAYYRRLRASGRNSNVNGDYAPPDQPYEAFNISTIATTNSWGASLQATLQRSWAGMQHQLVGGIALDAGSTSFAQSEQPAMFAGDRDTIGVGDYVPENDVGATNRYGGVYIADTIAIAPQWSLSLSGRYNTARITTQDRSGERPAIDGTNTFRRFNPAVGVTWAPGTEVNAFASYSQGMRVPTPVELTCADPDAPCTLPNIFVADPPLKPVLATTFEAGVRGRIGTSGFYSAAIYRTELADDIQFIGAGSGAVNAGYFQNVGKTRRQGLELTGGANLGTVRLVARYSLLDATFQTGFAESSPNNSSANADGLITVQPGNRLPTLPRNAFRLRTDWSHGPFAVGATLAAFDSQFSRGNENNADPAGRVPGYAIVAVDASWNLAPEWQLFGRIDNVFNRTYQNFGILGANYFRGPGNTFDVGLAGPEAFRSPGAPIGAWIGVQYRLDRGAGSR
ncbi:MAG TPA: TonB-dependent receptor [Casimicrobiaceae bacterium]|nr:TonB-dependent receptor [Casimicrobiaceae bacterium]